MVLIYAFFVINNGELRIYMFIGMAIGLIIYFLFLSKFFIKINLKILTMFKFVVSQIIYIILFPIKIIKRLLFKPISFIIINLRITMRNFKIVMSKLLKKAIKLTKLKKKNSN